MTLGAVRRAEHVTAEKRQIVIHSDRIEAILALWVTDRLSICCFFYGILVLVKLFSRPTGKNVSVKSFGCFSHSLSVSLNSPVSYSRPHWGELRKTHQSEAYAGKK